MFQHLTPQAGTLIPLTFWVTQALTGHGTLIVKNVVDRKYNTERLVNTPTNSIDAKLPNVHSAIQRKTHQVMPSQYALATHQLTRLFPLPKNGLLRGHKLNLERWKHPESYIVGFKKDG